MNSKLRWIKRPEKSVARNYVIPLTEKAAKCVAMLPGVDKVDVKLGIENGLLNRDTFVIAIEKDIKIAQSIKTFLSQNFNDYYVHVGPIEKLELDKVGPCLIDFASFDLCGNMTPKVAYWLNKYSDQFADDVKIHFTFKATHRKKDFQKAIVKAVGRKADDYKIGLCENNINDSLLNYSIKQSRNQSLNRINVITSVKAVCFTLQAAISRETTINRVYMYKDNGHCEMVCISMTIHKNMKVIDDDISDIFSHYDKTQPRYRQLMHRDARRRRVGRPKTKKVDFRTLFGIETRSDLDLAGKKAYITRTCNQWGWVVGRVIAGMNRSFTVEENKQSRKVAK